MEVLKTKFRNLFGLDGGGSRKRPFEEGETKEESEEKLDERPFKRMRTEEPVVSGEIIEERSKSDLNVSIALKSNTVSPIQKVIGWFFGGWRTGVAAQENMPPPISRIPPLVEVGETIQALAPTRLNSSGGDEVQLVKVINKIQQEPKEDTNISYDPLSSFSGFSSQGSTSDSISSTPPGPRPGLFIRTSYEKNRHEIGNSPSNLRRGLKSGFRSTYDRFFTDRNIAKSKMSRTLKKPTKTAFSHSAQLGEKDLYRKVLENYSASSARSRNSLIKSPLITRRAAGLFQRPLFGKTDTASSSSGTPLVTSTTIKSGSTKQERDSSQCATSPVLLPSRCREEDVQIVQDLSGTADGKVENVAPLPENSLEKKLKEHDVYSSSFLARLREKYDTSLRERRSGLEQEVQADVNERLRNYLRITQVAEDEDTEEEEEEQPTVLPEITEAMEDVIKMAKRAKGGVLVDAHKIQISGKDIDTLKGLNWLNDEVINFYIQMIVTRSTGDKYPSVYAFSTFFYPKLMETGHAGVKRWTKRVDLFSHDLVLVPVHLGMHWCLAVLDIQKKAISYYDSMGGNNRGCLAALEKYLQEEYSTKKSASLDTASWTKTIVKDIPQQMNGSDCGMFACKFAEYLSRRARITFSQKDMPYFRNRMIWEIVKNTLLHP